MKDSVNFGPFFIRRDKKILSFPVTYWDFSGSVSRKKNFLPEKIYQSFLVNIWYCFIYLIIKAHTEHVFINLNQVLRENGDKMVSLKMISYNRQRSYEIIIFLVALFASAIEQKNSKINHIITFAENCQ